MPENLISLEPDKFYHIYNHAIGKENFFETDADYLWFLNKLKKYVVPLCDIYSFCLMASHFHFVLRIKSEIEIKNILNKLNAGRLSVEESRAKDEAYLSNAVSQQMGNYLMLMPNILIMCIKEKERCLHGLSGENG